jgi:hypothetical protein
MDRRNKKSRLSLMIERYFNDRKISTLSQYSLADLAKPRAVEFLQARIARHEAVGWVEE